MHNLLKSGLSMIGMFIRAATCIVSVAMLLSFPLTRAHSFGQHFGTTEIRHSIVRHTFVAGPESSGAEKIVHFEALPSIPEPAVLVSAATRLFPLPLLSIVPTFRILHHFKLGPSRSGASDPLI